MTRMTFRGDSHFACPEVMSWCEQHDVSYVFGLAGTKPLAKKAEDVADAIRTVRAVNDADVIRGLAETKHRAESWTNSGRVVARIEATRLGCDRRYIVTNIETGTAEWLYDSLYSARGQAENLIKLHKSQLASDRTSCRSPLANQVRLILHTAAYWLMLAVRDAIHKIQDLAGAEFKTLRLRLLKIAARIIETKSRIRVAFATACPRCRIVPRPGNLVIAGRTVIYEAVCLTKPATYQPPAHDTEIKQSAECTRHRQTRAFKNHAHRPAQVHKNDI